MRFGSAGLHVQKSMSSPQSAIEAAQRFGVDLLSHRSQVVSAALVESYDMIVAMEVWQYFELAAAFGEQRHKLFLMPLLDAARTERCHGYAAFNIRDPYGDSPAAFNACFAEIQSLIECLFRRIKI
jgi:protein-tyrosine-phosphatase